ncbi:MAG: MmgE/PrpD family protein [Pseudolabrys sp.]
MPALTSDIAEFVTSVEVGALPEQCSYGARIGMVDCVGVMIAGASEPVVRLVTTTIATSTQNEGAPEIPSGRNLAATDAALVNGVDVAMDGHPVPCSRRRSWPKAGRSTSAAATRSQPM